MDLTNLHKRVPAQNPLLLKSFCPNPIDQLQKWLQDVIDLEISDCNALALATASSKGAVSSRMLLLKHIDHNGLIFYTHYNSQKGKNLEENPYASATFFWKELNRQVCLQGFVAKIGLEQSKAYFFSRPREHQLVTLASQQDAPIESKKLLEDKVSELESQYKDKQLPYPKNWGGYTLMPHEVEFWQGGPNRLNDRLRYTLEGDKWVLQQLSP